MVLDWIKQGNVYYDRFNNLRDVPDHPNLDAEQGDRFCITAFPHGMLRYLNATVGEGERQLLPGTYRYYDQNGGERVSRRYCSLVVNPSSSDSSTTDLTYGEPFEFTFHTYHGRVGFYCGTGILVRSGD